MPRKRNNGLSEEKRNIIGQLVEMYDIKTAADIQEALKEPAGRNDPVDAGNGAVHTNAGARGS